MKILNVAKAALYGIFLHYYCYYVLKGAFIPRGTVILFAVALVCVVTDIVSERRIYIDSEIKCWLIYAALAFITTGFITSGNGFIGDIAKFVQRILIVFMIAYICERENSVRFGLRLMAVTAVAAAVSILLVTDDIRLKLSISTEASLSANDIGALMAFGCFAVLFAFFKRHRTSLVLAAVKVAAIIMCLIVIFLAGSRKSIIAVLIMAVLLAFLWFTDYRKHNNAYHFITVLVVGIAAYWVVSEFLIQYADETNLYTRLFGRGAEGANQSDDVRIDLYITAIQDFFNHPLFGVGFAQYEKLHGTYSHSTYIEPLACSGIIGFLYLYPYFSLLRKQIYLIKESARGSLERLKQKEIMIYLIMFLFIAVGIPYMYKDIPCILLGTFIASQNISFREKSRMGHTSAEY